MVDCRNSTPPITSRKNCVQWTCASSSLIPRYAYDRCGCPPKHSTSGLLGSQLSRKNPARLKVKSASISAPTQKRLSSTGCSATSRSLASLLPHSPEPHGEAGCSTCDKRHRALGGRDSVVVVVIFASVVVAVSGIVAVAAVVEVVVVAVL